MKRLIAASILALCPLQALGNEAADCDAAWQDIVIFAGALGAGISEARVTAEADGWCAVSVTTDWAVNFGVIDAAFRVDRFGQALPDARSFEVVITDLQTEFGSFEVAASLSHQAVTETLRLHAFSARADDGRGLRATANTSLGGLASRADALAVLSELAIKTTSVEMFVTPALLQDAGVDFSELTRVAINDALRDVDESQVSRRARSEFLRFVGATPNARGTLGITLDTPMGANLLQLATPFLALGRTPDDAAIAKALSTALTDAELDLAWKPGRM